MNFENLLYSTMSQQANLFINKKILAQVGLNLAAFISFLIDKGRYHKEKEELSDDGFFYATNEDIHLFTGLPMSVISNLKKEGEKLNLFKVKKLKNSFEKATYYKLNYEVILTLLSSEKSTLELAYERELPTDIDFSQDGLIKFGCRDLRLLCKQLKVSYSGKDNKQTMINKIIKKMGNVKEEKIEEILENTGLDVWTKKSSIGGQNIRSSVDKKIDHQWTEKLIIDGQKNCHKKNQIQKNQIQKNQIIDDSLKIFEKLFDELGITFTKTNQTSILKLLKTMKEKEVILYLKETYENIKVTPEVKNAAALFSKKISKGERQINSTSITKEKNTTEITKETKNQEKAIVELFSIEKKQENRIELSPEEEKKLLEKAKKDPSINIKFILKMKDLNRIVYYNTLLKFRDINSL